MKVMEGVLSKSISLADLIVEGDIFTVTAGDSSWNYFEFDNYKEALEKFEELKGKGFCRVQLLLHRVLEVEGE